METAMEYWENEMKDLAPGTRDHYRRYFNKFLERYNLTPEELFNIQNEGRLSPDPRKARVVEQMVREYMRELQNDGYAPGTARNVAKAVKSFMIANSLEFNLRRKPPSIYNGSRAIRDKHIRLMYYDLISSEFLKRNRTLTMFLKDSGLRVSDASELNAEDYWAARIPEEYEEGELFRVFTPVRTQKTGHIAQIHIGPEAVKDLEDYLDGRCEGPLFIARNGERLTGEAMTSLFMRLMKPIKEMGFKVSAHSFRKFHRTSLESVMNDQWINALQGKASDVYSHPEDLEKLTPAYIKGYDQLRVLDTDEVVREKQQKEIDKLKEAIEKQQDLVKSLSEEIELAKGEPAELTLVDVPGSTDGRVKVSDIQKAVKELVEKELKRARESQQNTT